MHAAATVTQYYYIFLKKVTAVIIVIAVVNRPSKGKCGRFHQHLGLQLDTVVVIPCLVQRLKPTAFCVWTKKVISQDICSAARPLGEFTRVT